MNFQRYICKSAEKILSNKVLVGLPAPCGCCKAEVRKIAADRFNGYWLCPVCGTELPFVFWKVSHEPQARMVAKDELVLGLADDACQECGESKIGGQWSEAGQGCRCDRIKTAKGTKS